jgi:hypothetical protein
VDFFEDAVTFREKAGAVEEITSGDRIYQAYLDLERATAREVFEHINPDITKERRDSPPLTCPGAPEEWCQPPRSRT